MYRRTVIFLAMTQMAGALSAADVSGKWTAKVPGRGGETRDTTFTFKQDGATLTGSMTGRDGDIALENGKVEGDAVSFSVSQGQAKVNFKGTVAGAEIKFTRQREGGDPREFTAKRGS